MSIPGHRFTYADYRLLPEDMRYELVDGELLLTPAPAVRHQMILSTLLNRLYTFVEVRGLGQVLPAPTDVILSNETVVQPDILYIAADRLGIMNADGGVHSAPDLVAEILSPSTAPRDQVLKRKLFSKYGVCEYWIVDPAGRSVEVLAPVGAELQTWQVFATDATLVSPLLPGLTIPVHDLFPE